MKQDNTPAANEAAETSLEWHRVFIALWPDPAVRASLAKLARRLDAPGRPVPAAHLHLTLAFAGKVTREQCDCLAARIREWRAPSIAVHLDQLGHFPRARVAWVGPRVRSHHLAEVATHARQICDNCAISLPDLPFHPHVTLRRHVAALPSDPGFKPIDWRSGRIVLVESGKHGKPGSYRVIAEAKRA